MDNESDGLAKRQYNTIILAGVGIAILFYPVVGTLLITKSMAILPRVWISIVLRWITIPILYQYANKVEARDAILWKEEKRGILFYILAIIALFILAYLARLIAHLPEQFGFHDDYTRLRYYHTIYKEYPELMVIICITAGFTEEFIIRGYVLSRLSLIFDSKYVSIGISSLIFSLLHLGYGNLGECVFTFLFGFICAFCYERYRNIKLLMIFHFLYDLSVLVR